MIQKLLRVGSSAAVTIPKKSLGELGLKIGDSVALSIDTAKRRVIIEAPGTAVDKELVGWTKKFIAENKKVLEALSDK